MLQLTERAQAAFDQSSGQTRKQLESQLTALAKGLELPNIKTLSAPSGKRLWIIPVNNDLRLIFSRESDQITILDILDRVQYDRFRR
jgi:hypothetical protein